MTGPELFAATKLAPEQAVAYLKGKGLVIADAWHEVWEAAHAKAFTVARATRLDVLTELHAEVMKIGTEGSTEAEFLAALTPRLKAKGWWGPEERVDPATGEITVVQLGSPHRLKTIYRTNAATAYSAGRYKFFMENQSARPYWQYVAVLDARTRPAHQALDGKVFALDDPATGIFWPPNDWGCRCRARALSAEDLARKGLVPEDTAGKIGWEDVPVGKDGEPRPRATYRTTDALGDPVTFRAGAGWSSNPGQAAWQPELERYPYAVARQYVRGAIGGLDFTRFFAGEAKGRFPVAVLSPADRQAIGAKSQVVQLSDETLTKNRAAHPEIGVAELRELQGVIEGAEIVVEKRGLIEVFVRRREEMYFAVIKTTQDRGELYLTSYRKTNEADVRREMKHGRVLRNLLW